MKYSLENCESLFTILYQCFFAEDCIISEKHLAKLVQQVLLGTAEKCRAEDITAAEAVVSQLLRVPDFTATLHKQKLIITKVICYTAGFYISEVANERAVHLLVDGYCRPWISTADKIEVDHRCLATPED